MPYADFFHLAAMSGDDLLLVAIHIQHHGSHHETVFEQKLS